MPILKRNLLTLLTSLLLANTLLLSGCSWGFKVTSDNDSLLTNEELSLKIMYDYDEQQFYNQYGTLFASKFPNINLEVMNTQLIESSAELTDEEVYSFIEKEKPDVLLLSMNQYEQLANEGKLYDLEQLFAQSDYDLNGIHPAIIKLIRDQSFGKLFGLAPTFESKALIYNVDLFEKYNIDPPTDSMSWKEIIEKAKLFTTEQHDVYGFSAPMYSTYADFAYSIALTSGLSMLNEKKTEVLLQTDSWRQVFQSTLDAANSDSILFPSSQDSLSTMQDYYNSDPFISGKLAMKLINPYELQSFAEARQVVGEEQMPSWELVSAPVEANNRSQSKEFHIQKVYAIYAGSTNIEAAWEFIQYIHSSEFARIQAKIPYSELLQSQTAFIPDIFGVSMEPFYKLEPGERTDPLDGTIEDFKYNAISIIEDELQNVLNNVKSLEDAIIDMETRAKAQLDQSKQ